VKFAITAAIVTLFFSATSAAASFVVKSKGFEGTTMDVADLSVGKAPRISWADAKHRYGWVTSESPQRRYCSRDGNVLCATDDGGKHWRAIFRGGNYIFGYLRWSKNAGVLSAGAYSHGELWTRDGGRHWWGTHAFWLGANADLATGFGPGPGFSVARERGRRQLRYAYAQQWPYRVLGWVPTRPLKCAGEWARWGGETIGPRNICGGPMGGDGMSARPVGPTARLTVNLDAETDDGLVESSPVGIDCGTITPWNAQTRHGTACAASFGKGSTVTLRPLVSLNLSPQVVHWSGCTDVRPFPDPRVQPWCVVTLAEDTEVTASFRLSPPTPAAR
jgi:hypothetical protein